MTAPPQSVRRARPKRPALAGADAASQRLWKACDARDEARAVQALMDGADPNVRGSFGATPLMLAAGPGALGLVERLLRAGARPNDRDTTGDTPLHWVLLGCNDPAVAALLLEAGADWRAHNAKGQTAEMLFDARNGVARPQESQKAVALLRALREHDELSQAAAVRDTPPARARSRAM